MPHRLLLFSVFILRIVSSALCGTLFPDGIGACPLFHLGEVGVPSSLFHPSIIGAPDSLPHPSEAADSGSLPHPNEAGILGPQPYKEIPSTR